MTTSLSTLNIESELSYAYLHAVASHAGMNCKVGNRHDDNAGIDASLTAWGPFSPTCYTTEVDLKIQLKSTISPPTIKNGKISYFLKGKDQYDNLRAQTLSVPRFLVVLFLPREANEWLTHTTEQLILKKCAYWVSLRGAPETTNDTGVTIHIPLEQTFSTDNIKHLVARLAQRDFPRYEEA